MPPSFNFRQQRDAVRHYLGRCRSAKPEHALEERWIDAKPILCGWPSASRMEAALINSTAVFVHTLKPARRLNTEGENEPRTTVLLELKREDVCSAGA